MTTTLVAALLALPVDGGNRPLSKSTQIMHLFMRTGSPAKINVPIRRKHLASGASKRNFDRMKWRDLRETSGLPMLAGYELRQPSAEEIPILVREMQNWYPDITVGAESCHLEEKFFLERVVLRDGSHDRDVYALTWWSGDELASLVTFERNVEARTISGRLGAIHPAHRGSGLAPIVIQTVEHVARFIGAELFYYFATLTTPHQQYLAEKLGFQLVGIVPAFDRDMVKPGEVRRVYEAIFAKVLIAQKDVMLPPIETFTPNTRRIWNALFSG